MEITLPVNQQEEIKELKQEIAEIKALLASTSNLSLAYNYVEDEYTKNNKLEEELL